MPEERVAITLPTEVRKGLAPEHSEAMMVQVGAVGEARKPVVF